jgi:inhibitor of the pro-sigma K processing machinery
MYVFPITGINYYWVMIMLKNIKWALKNLIIGLVLIYVVNFFGVDFNINIPINIITILVVGFLRIPGLITLLVLAKI